MPVLFLHSGIGMVVLPTCIPDIPACLVGLLLRATDGTQTKPMHTDQRGAGRRTLLRVC